MGVNYYIRNGKKECVCCGSEVDNMLHIGKKSFGWEFSFKAHKDLNINSFGDWIKFLDNSTEDIIDEYGDVISKTDFYIMVERSKNCKNKNHYKEYKNNPYNTSFLDEDGYSFDYAEFS